MKTRLHTADVLTFTLTGTEPQRALTLAALHNNTCLKSISTSFSSAESASILSALSVTFLFSSSASSFLP